MRVLGRGDRRQSPITRTTPPVQARTHAGQYLDDVAHQIIGGLTVVNDDDPAALCSQGGMQMLHPETGQPIPMLHNNHHGRRVRQNPSQLRPLTVYARADLGHHLTHLQPTDVAHPVNRAT